MMYAEYERDSQYILLSSDNFAHGLAITQDEARELIDKLPQLLAEIAEKKAKEEL